MQVCSTHYGRFDGTFFSYDNLQGLQDSGGLEFRMIGWFGFLVSVLGSTHVRLVLRCCMEACKAQIESLCSPIKETAGVWKSYVSEEVLCFLAPPWPVAMPCLVFVGLESRLLLWSPAVVGCGVQKGQGVALAF